MSKRLLALTTLAMFSLSVLLFGCGQSKQITKASTETVIKVGSETTFAPFEFQDEQTKEYVGFDIDLMQAIGAKMGVKVEIASMGFDGLIPALNAGNIDAAISGMTITEERKQKVAFSDPYYHCLLYTSLAERLYKIGNEWAEGWNFGPNDCDVRTVGELVRRLGEKLNFCLLYTSRCV